MGVRVCFGKTLVIAVASNTKVTTNISTWRDSISESCPHPYSSFTVPASYPAAGLYTRLTTKLTFSTHHQALAARFAPRDSFSSPSLYKT